MSPSAILALLSLLCPCGLWTLRMSCTQVLQSRVLYLVLVWGIAWIQGKDLPLFVLKEVSASNLCHTERTWHPQNCSGLIKLNGNLDTSAEQCRSQPGGQRLKVK